eukprot:TRINITY_DN10803_c0_g1_i1.p1 TRINITY_DN10803_c0_g1~~TRINITY_DN10803_c0_g1_i1.p1  ORF type:complete len:193 (+),score=61.84 TRINITY_DN10803_c0_g1_i1:101-679(+)
MTSTTNANDTIATYLADMVALNDHIQTVLDRQQKNAETSFPEYAIIIGKWRTALIAQKEGLQARLNEFGGGGATGVIKQTVSVVAGVAAGIIDTVRPDFLSKQIRDDYTAIALDEIGYQMLFCTATALNDSKTAELAKTYAAQNAGFLKECQMILPQIIVSELNKNYEGIQLSQTAVPATQDMVRDVWGGKK